MPSGHMTAPGEISLVGEGLGTPHKPAMWSSPWQQGPPVPCGATENQVCKGHFADTAIWTVRLRAFYLLGP